LTRGGAKIGHGIGPVTDGAGGNPVFSAGRARRCGLAGGITSGQGLPTMIYLTLNIWFNLLCLY